MARVAADTKARSVGLSRGKLRTPGYTDLARARDSFIDALDTSRFQSMLRQTAGFYERKYDVA